MDSGLSIPPDGPALLELKRVSPTVGSLLLDCELSVAFRLDTRYSAVRRTSPAAALGTISHALAKAVAAGEFDDATDEREALDAAWEARVAAIAPVVSEGHHGVSRLPARWPGYESVHVRTIDALADEVATRRSARDRVPHSIAIAVEVQLQPDDLPLEGRADRVERDGGGVELVDLKTGWAPPTELKPRHRRQLLVYAYLWHAIHGVWPRRASVQMLGGSRLTFDVEPEEAENAAAQLIAARAAYNAHVAAHTDANKLARPDKETCLHCDFRLACRPFFDALAENWGWYRRNCLGRITRATQAQQRVRLDLVVTAGNVTTPRITLLGVPTIDACAPGEMVTVVDAIPTRQPDVLRWDIETRLCVWQPAASRRRQRSC